MRRALSSCAHCVVAGYGLQRTCLDPRADARIAAHSTGCPSHQKCPASSPGHRSEKKAPGRCSRDPAASRHIRILPSGVRHRGPRLARTRPRRTSCALRQGPSSVAHGRDLPEAKSRQLRRWSWGYSPSQLVGFLPLASWGSRQPPPASCSAWSRLLTHSPGGHRSEDRSQDWRFRPSGSR